MRRYIAVHGGVAEGSHAAVAENAGSHGAVAATRHAAVAQGSHAAVAEKVCLPRRRGRDSLRRRGTG